MSLKLIEGAEAHEPWSLGVQALGNSVAFPLYVATPDGDIRFVNDRWLEFTGLTEWESLGRRWMKIVHPADLPALEQSIAENLAEPQRVTGEIRLRRADGEYRLVSVTSIPFLDDEGETAGFVGTVTDETVRKRVVSKLEETSERLHTVVEAIPEAVVLKDPDGHWQTANREALKLFELEDVDWQNRTDQQLGQLVPRLAEVFDSLRLGDEHAWRMGQRYNSIDLLRDPSGLPMYLDASRVPLYRANGQRRALVMLGRKASERRVTVDDGLSLAALAFEQNSEAIMITDPQQRILRVNRAFTEITGFLPEEVLGRTPRMLSSGRHDQMFYASMWQSLALNQRWQGEIWNRRKNGEVYPEWLSITAVRDSSGRVQQYVASFSDVADKKRIEEERRRHALYDALTGLGNRTLIEERLTHHLETGRERVALLLVNLSRFGQVNFLFGFRFGDAVLKTVGQILKDNVGKRGTVGRWAGDQFALVVPLPHDSGNVQRSMVELLQDVQAAFLSRITIEGQSVQLRCSIGIAVAPDDAPDTSGLIRGAEAALANAKRGSETYCFHTAQMEEGVRFRLALEQELAPALEAGELTLAYQPVLDLASGRVTGAEALLRWKHPERGGIPPDVFIRIAEECGVITAIGRFVLRTACRQLREWLDAGLNLTRLSVNVSTLELLNPDFEAFVHEVLTANGLEPRFLELEITESIFIDEESSTVAGLLRSLHDYGVRLAIDDFGTRFSTLSYLNRLPVDTLKIDRSFVTGLPDDAGSVALTRAILVLARNLDLEVIAEGVESAAQAAFFAENGCQCIQGFHLSEAVPGEEFAARVGRVEGAVVATSAGAAET